jgi:cation:H+ antiporter
VGSNIFNLLGVLGLGALLAPQGISVAAHVLWLDFPVMVFVALVSLPVFYIDSRISRVEGGLLLGYYVLYITYVLLQASNSSALLVLHLFAAIFAPITFVALVVFAIRSALLKKKE